MWYFPIKFSSDDQKLLDQIVSLLRGPYYQLLPLDIRTIYYQLIGLPDPLIQNLPKGYNKVKIVVRDARYCGQIPFEWIEDLTRYTYNHAVSLEEALSHYYPDAWRNQPIYIEVFVEKKGLAPFFARALRPLYVKVTPGGGHNSLTNVMEMAQRFHNYANRPRYLFVFSDLDASGDDIARDIQFRLGECLMMLGEEPIRYAKTRKMKIVEIENLTVQKEALTFQQARELNLPAMFQNPKDPRAGDFISRYGDKAVVELNAVPPDILNKMILDSVGLHLDSYDIDRVRWEEERIRLNIVKALENSEGDEENEHQED